MNSTYISPDQHTWTEMRI